MSSLAKRLVGFVLVIALLLSIYSLSRTATLTIPPMVIELPNIDTNNSAIFCFIASVAVVVVLVGSTVDTKRKKKINKKEKQTKLPKISKMKK